MGKRDPQPDSLTTSAPTSGGKPVDPFASHFKQLVVLLARQVARDWLQKFDCTSDAVIAPQPSRARHDK